MDRRNIFILISAVIIIILSICVYAYELPKWFPFNTEGALEEWKEKIFKGRVLYEIEPKDQGGYLAAKSENACSGLFYKVRFDPEDLPLISWQWQVLKFPKKPDISAEGMHKTKEDGWIEKDDYAARVYVIFPRFNFNKTKCIEYVWDENLAEGTIMTSPFFENIKLIVVESGRRNLGRWISHTRNIYEDYKTTFGQEPSSDVGAIALMTDTDNTVSTAEALYKNLKVGYKNGDEYSEE